MARWKNRTRRRNKKYKLMGGGEPEEEGSSGKQEPRSAMQQRRNAGGSRRGRAGGSGRGRAGGRGPDLSLTNGVAPTTRSAKQRAAREAGRRSGMSTPARPPAKDLAQEMDAAAEKGGASRTTKSNSRSSMTKPTKSSPAAVAPVPGSMIKPTKRSPAAVAAKKRNATAQRPVSKSKGMDKTNKRSPSSPLTRLAVASPLTRPPVEEAPREQASQSTMRKRGNPGGRVPSLTNGVAPTTRSAKQRAAREAGRRSEVSTPARPPGDDDFGPPGKHGRPAMPQRSDTSPPPSPPPSPRAVAEQVADQRATRKAELEAMPALKLKATAKRVGVPIVAAGQPARTTAETVEAVLAVEGLALPVLSREQVRKMVPLQLRLMKDKFAAPELEAFVDGGGLEVSPAWIDTLFNRFDIYGNGSIPEARWNEFIEMMVQQVYSDAAWLRGGAGSMPPPPGWSEAPAPTEHGGQLRRLAQENDLDPSVVAADDTDAPPGRLKRAAAWFNRQNDASGGRLFLSSDGGGKRKRKNKRKMTKKNGKIKRKTKRKTKRKN